MIVSADAKAIEWRVLTELAPEPTALQEILEGQDTHELNRVAFNLPSRLIAKTYLFRTIYNHGKGYAFTVDPDFMHVSTSSKFWDKIGEKFYEKYAGLEQMYRRNASLVLAGETIRSRFGREWKLELKRGFSGDLEVPETLLVNYPVQGTAHDIMAIARVSLFNRLKKLPWGREVKLFATVHDSIDADMPEEFVQEYTNLCHQVFDDVPKNIQRMFKYTWNVPIACEVCCGPNMKDMSEVKRNDK